MSTDEALKKSYKMFFQDPKVLELRDQSIKKIIQSFASTEDASQPIIFPEIPFESDEPESDNSSPYITYPSADKSFEEIKTKAALDADNIKKMLYKSNINFATKVDNWLSESRHMYSKKKITLQDNNGFYECEKTIKRTDNKIRSNLSSDGNCSDASVDTAKYIRSNQNKKGSRVAMLTIKEFSIKLVEKSKSLSEIDNSMRSNTINNLKENTPSSNNISKMSSMSENFWKKKMFELNNNGIPEKYQHRAIQSASKSKLEKNSDNNKNKTNRLKLKNKEYRKKIENRNKSYVDSSDSGSDSVFLSKSGKCKKQRRLSSKIIKDIDESNARTTSSSPGSTSNEKSSVSSYKTNKINSKNLKKRSLSSYTLNIGDILIASNNNSKSIIITENELINVLGVEKSNYLLDDKKSYRCVLEPLHDLIYKPCMVDPLDDDEELFAKLSIQGYLKIVYRRV